MAVSQHQLDDIHTQLVNNHFQLFHVTARINHDALHGFITPDN